MSELIAADQRLWLKTDEMAAELGMHPMTLSKLKRGGYFVENHHWRPVNPTSKRSALRWHKQRTLMRMHAD